MLNSDKRDACFSQLLCIASMLVWSLYLKISLRVGFAMFSVTGSNSLYLQTFRFYTIFEKKLSRVSAVSDLAFKISLFSLTFILSLKRDLAKSKSFTDFHYMFLSVTFFTF